MNMELKIARIRARLSQRQLARLASERGLAISQTKYSHIENQLQDATRTEKSVIAELVGGNVDELWVSE